MRPGAAGPTGFAVAPEEFRVHADFTDLRLMVRIAEANSLTRGADLVHLSLPAASLCEWGQRRYPDV